MAALSEIEKLEARWAENPDGRYFAPLADAYRKAGRVDDAIMVVGEGLTKHPDYLSAHIVLGRCYLEKKDDAAALAAFEKVLGLDTENIIALKSLAEIAERQQRTDDARRWLQRLLTVDAMNTEAADDLTRLGGPIEAPAGEAAPAEVAAPLEDISFADVAPEPVVAAESDKAARISAAQSDPALMKLANQSTLHIPRPAPQASVPTEPVKAIDLDVALEKPPAPPVTTSAPPMLDIEPTAFEPPPAAPAAVPGLEQPESFAPPPVRMSQDVAPAIEFMGEPQKPERVSWSGAPEVGEIDLNKPPAPGGPRLTLGTSGAPVDLPLIMPEDVTPSEELRRPSVKQVQMVSPEPSAAGESGEPMLTETMGDLYLRQGFKDKAADVYRRLLAARPGDTMLKAKLAALESPLEALSAAAQGTEAVGSWLQRIARSSLEPSAPPPAAAAPLPPAPAASDLPEPEPGPSPMDQAFAAPEPSPPPAASTPLPPAPAASATAPSGAPAHPASDQFTLDRVFGGKVPGAAAPSGGAPAAPSSFDEFFGEAKPAPAKPQDGKSGPPGEEDLSAFTTWLHGLKR